MRSPRDDRRQTTLPVDPRKGHWQSLTEHSVKHGPDFVNLVCLVHGCVRLVDQVQETPEGDKAVTFHDFPETKGVRDEVVAGPLPVALTPRLDHALFHLKPKAEECFQLGDSDGLKILGAV